MLKKILYIIFLGIIFAECSLDKEPLNGPSTGTFPASEEEALAGVLAAYKSLANPIVQYCPWPYRLVDNCTDIGTCRVGTSPYTQMLNSSLTSDVDLVEFAYERIYKIAGRVHLVLDALENLRSKVSDQIIDQFKAELLCIRAFAYDQGCQFYGDIPFIDHSLGLNDYSYPRTPRKEVIERLLYTDLTDELLDNLPVQWPTVTYGTCRIGRATAYALKARIALNWGYYEEAARCSSKAISLSEGHYELEQLDCTYYATASDGEPSASELFGFQAESKSKEWMWALQYNILAASNTHGCIYTYAPRTHNGASFVGPSQGLMDTFQCKDGKAITESPLYNWQEPWKNRDPRLDLYTLRPDSRAMGIEFTTNVSVTKVTDYNNEAKKINNNDAVGNKSEYGANGTKGPGGYHWRKFYDNTYYGMIPGNSMEDELDVCLIRYAELLLIDAEANIEWEGGDLARAKKDIDKVRARVQMPPVDGSSREKLRSALRYERKVELCAEGYRWFDIRRWNIAKKAVAGIKYAPGFSTTTTPRNYISNARPIIDEDWVVTYDSNNTWNSQKFNLRIFQIMKFTEGKDELFPFPYTEMLSNPAIGLSNNNPGY